MKRNERTNYNHVARNIRKNGIESIINIEVPTNYTHEARQAFHELLTAYNLRAVCIYWNDIEKTWALHYEPARYPEAHDEKRRQEAEDVDAVTARMTRRNWTWNGYPAPAAEAEAETAEQVEEIEAETIEETAEEAKEVTTMKKYFKVTFEYAEGIYCTNLAHAETAEDVEREYSKYTWRSVKEAQPWDVEEAKMKGMPIIEVEAAQQPQEAQQEAPAAEAEQQPTETENAPQAATQAAEVDAITYTTDDDPDPAPGLLIHRPGSARGIIIGDGVMLPDDPADLLTAYGEREYSRDAAGNYMITTDEKKEDKTMTTTEREALERINARQNAANLFTNIGPEEIAAELAAMEAEQAAPAPDPDAATLAPADAAQVWTEEGKTITPEDITTNEQKEEDKTMTANKLYLSNWDYNAALIIEELAAIVKNNGGTVKPGTETIIENRALNENLRKAADRMTQLESIEAEAPGTNEHRTDAIKRLRADIEKWERIDNTPRTVHHCTWSSAYISFKLGGMYYYYQTDSNPFFDFYYQKTPIDVNGTVSRCACLESDKKEWLYDCFFRAEATDADRREAANLIYNMLVKAAPP